MGIHIREKRPYRFGGLKETLIEWGIKLVHEWGTEKFSLRKAARRVSVSATACYNHFGNIDELLRGMYSYMIDKFAAALKQATEDNPCHNVTISIGVAYVEFFAKYPHYFSLLFGSECLGIRVKETEITWNNSFTPFEIFINGAKRGVKELSINEKESKDDLLIMWATVHGLTVMANMKGVQYDNGD